MRKKNIQREVQGNDSVENKIDIVAADGIIKKMHHMPWLKQQPNRSEQNEEEMSSRGSDKEGGRGKKKNRGQRSKAQKGTTVSTVDTLPGFNSSSQQSAGAKSVWDCRNVTGNLFPEKEAANHEPQNDPEDDPELRRALEESLKSAEEEKAKAILALQCQIRESELIRGIKEEAEKSDDEDYWSGKKRNLPSSEGEGPKICDTNNNAGHDNIRGSKIPTNETRNIVGRSIMARKGNVPTERNEKSEICGTPLNIPPLSSPATPNLCDKFGRSSAYIEQHPTMIRGARKKEQPVIQQCQQKNSMPLNNTTPSSFQDPTKFDCKNVPFDNPQNNYRSKSSVIPTVYNDKYHYTRNAYENRGNPSSNDPRIAKSVNTEPEKTRTDTLSNKNVKSVDEKQDWMQNTIIKRLVSTPSNDKNMDASYATSLASSQPEVTEKSSSEEQYSDNNSWDLDPMNLSLRDFNSRHNPPKKDARTSLLPTPEVSLDSSTSAVPRVKDEFHDDEVYDYRQPNFDYAPRNLAPILNPPRPEVDRAKIDAPYERMLIYEPSLYNLLLQRQIQDGCQHAVLLPINLRNQDNFSVNRCQPEVNCDVRNGNSERNYQQYQQEIPTNACKSIIGIPFVMTQRDPNFYYAAIPANTDIRPETPMQYVLLKNDNSMGNIVEPNFSMNPMNSHNLCQNQGPRMITGVHTFSPGWETSLTDLSLQKTSEQFHVTQNFDSSMNNISTNQEESRGNDYYESTATSSKSFVESARPKDENVENYGHSDNRQYRERYFPRNFPPKSRIPENRRGSSNNYNRDRQSREHHNISMDDGNYYGTRSNENSGIRNFSRGKGRPTRKR